jgi:hypothetical protein
MVPGFNPGMPAPTALPFPLSAIGPHTVFPQIPNTFLAGMFPGQPGIPIASSMPAATAPTVAASPVVSARQLQLHDSRVKATRSHPNNASNNLLTNQQATRNVAPVAAQPSTAPVTKPTNYPYHYAIAAMPPPSATVPTVKSLDKEQTGNTSNLLALESTTPSQPDFPDFMAGFDNVALSIKPDPSILPPPAHRNSLQCSPPFTSRSFDDFHRFLGEDLAPLDGTVVSSTKDEADKGLLDNSALFTAEAYAMFAQESTVAGSHHAAYLAGEHDEQLSRTERIGSFDIDSALKMVSHHVLPAAPTASTMTSIDMGESKVDRRPRHTHSSNFPTQPDAEEKSRLEVSIAEAMSSTQQAQVPADAALVSGSEPNSSANESSQRGFTSESNGSDNTFNNSDDNFFESGESNASDDESSYNSTAASYRRGKRGGSFESFSSGPLNEGSRASDNPSGRHSKRRRLSSVGSS